MPRKSKSPAAATPRPLSGPQRLNKILAAAGLGSRRQVEQLITDGRIEVDGQPVTDLATKIDPETAKLTFDGSALKIFRPVYFALNKPVGVLSTNSDPSGRMRIIDLVNVKERIFSAGRLDRSSEGLMLLTNDGELVQRLCHPRYGIQKLYLATVQGEITQADLEKLIRGVRLSEGYAKVDAVKLRKQRSGAADLEIALSEGKNREIRRILARLGHKVVALKRLAIGPLRLGPLPTGGWRPLTRHEVEALYAATLSSRRKRRGTGKPLRGKKDESTQQLDKPAGALSAGQFDDFFSSHDDDDDEFMPSLIDQPDDDDDLGDDIVPIMVGDHSIVGTVLGYEEDEVPDDEDEAPARRPKRPAQRPAQRSARASSPRSKVGGGKRAPARGRSSSPNDLRNRRPAADSGAGEYRQEGDRSATRGPRSKSAPKRGFKSAPKRGAKGTAKSAPRSAPKAGFKSAPRRGAKKRGKR